MRSLYKNATIGDFHGITLGMPIELPRLVPGIVKFLTLIDKASTGTRILIQVGDTRMWFWVLALTGTSKKRTRYIIELEPGGSDCKYVVKSKRILKPGESWNKTTTEKRDRDELASGEEQSSSARPVVIKVRRNITARNRPTYPNENEDESIKISSNSDLQQMIPVSPIPKKKKGATPPRKRILAISSESLPGDGVSTPAVAPMPTPTHMPTVASTPADLLLLDITYSVVASIASRVRRDVEERFTPFIISELARSPAIIARAEKAAADKIAADRIAADAASRSLFQQFGVSYQTPQPPQPRSSRDGLQVTPEWLVDAFDVAHPRNSNAGPGNTGIDEYEPAPEL